MKLAIIGPAFFGYLEELADSFTRSGINAAFYDERPSNSVSSKVVFRLASQSMKARIAKQHLENLCEQVIRAGSTHVLLVSVEIVDSIAVQRFREANLKVSRYGWDSVRNKPLMHSLDPLMDHIASFDGQDCETYGYSYIPLYSSLTADPTFEQVKETDFFYCTTLHSNRPLWVTRFLEVINAKGWQANFLLFYHNRLLWWVQYIKTPSVWGLLKSISTISFSRDEIALATQAAKVVLDIHHGAQTGLTMRTYEALSLGVVLLTTNKAAFQYLPEDLHDRLVFLDAENLTKSMQTALERTPAPLTPAQSHSLSRDRFIAQLTALINGDPVPSAHQ